MRQFESGATRDVDTNKYDYEGFLHPLVLEAYGEYMHRHRKMPNGSLRASDNWTKGIPLDELLKSEIRHMMGQWKLHKMGYVDPRQMMDACCGVFFNVQGYMLGLIKQSVIDKP